METKNYIKENYHPQLQGQKLKKTVIIVPPLLT